MKKVLLTFLLGCILGGSAFSKGNKIPLIGAKAPSFTAESTNGKINFPEDYGKSWKILFSHPQDFTPVCTSEILELANMQKDFRALGTQIAIISSDNLVRHNMWKTQLEQISSKGREPQKIEFPLFDDHLKVVSKKYGMIHDRASTTRDIRGVYIIDPNNIVRSINFYPMQVGRNMKEVERILVALQTVDKERVYTPENWNVGDDILIPYYPFTDKELAEKPELADKYYQQGFSVWYKKEQK